MINSQENLEDQLQMTPQTWRAMQRGGIKPGDKLELEFLYDAPGQKEAESLVNFISSNSNARVIAKSTGIFRKKWTVEGSTPPEAVDEPFLLKWVRWMVLAGNQYDCEFDGWGAWAPDDAG